MKKIYSVILAMLCSFLLCLTGCGKLVLSTAFHGNVMVSYGAGTLLDSQVRMIAMNYKAEYENYYAQLLGTGFWDSMAGESLTFEQYIKEYNIWTECQTLTALLDVAKDCDVSLTDVEKAAADSHGEAYYAQLTQDERNYAQTTLDETKDLFQKYKLAEKTITHLIGDATVEVSDEQSRVMEIQVIHVASREFANELKTRLDNGESFSALAIEHTLDSTVSYSVGRGDLCEPFDSVVFSMGAGDVSNVISFGNTYYILRCQNTYDTLLSQENKSNLLKTARYQYWNEAAKQYLEGDSPARNATSWNEISLKVEGEFIHSNLYEYINQ